MSAASILRAMGRGLAGFGRATGQMLRRAWKPDYPTRPWFARPVPHSLETLSARPPLFGPTYTFESIKPYLRGNWLTRELLGWHPTALELMKYGPHRLMESSRAPNAAWRMIKHLFLTHPFSRVFNWWAAKDAARPLAYLGWRGAAAGLNTAAWLGTLLSTSYGSAIAEALFGPAADLEDDVWLNHLRIDSAPVVGTGTSFRLDRPSSFGSDDPVQRAVQRAGRIAALKPLGSPLRLHLTKVPWLGPFDIAVRPILDLAAAGFPTSWVLDSYHALMSDAVQRLENPVWALQMREPWRTFAFDIAPTLRRYGLWDIPVVNPRAPVIPLPKINAAVDNTLEQALWEELSKPESTVFRMDSPSSVQYFARPLIRPLVIARSFSDEASKRWWALRASQGEVHPWQVRELERQEAMARWLAAQRAIARLMLPPGAQTAESEQVRKKIEQSRAKTLQELRNEYGQGLWTRTQDPTLQWLRQVSLPAVFPHLSPEVKVQIVKGLLQGAEFDLDDPVIGSLYMDLDRLRHEIGQNPDLGRRIDEQHQAIWQRMQSY